MCLQFQASMSTCHLHAHVSQMPQWYLARDSDPTSLVCLVSKPHHPVGAQQKLRSLLLWRFGGGDVVCDQWCPPRSLHPERRWDGAVGLGHWRRSRLPCPPQGHPPHLPLPQPSEPLSFQLAQVLSAPSVSATARDQPLSSAPASPQPPGCPRSSRGAEAHSIVRAVPPAGFASGLPFCLQDEIRAELLV